MIRKYLLPVLAVAGTLLAVFVVRAGMKPVPASQPVAQPSGPPFASYVAGAAIVEAVTENVAIGTGEGGTVIEVSVKVGDAVTKGQPLFKIRNFTQTAEWQQAQGKELEARAAVKQFAATLARSTADLRRLAEAPRPEEVTPARAKVKEAEAVLADMTAQYDLWQSVYAKDNRAVSGDDLARKRYAVDTARAKFDAATADLTLLLAGTWKPDLDVARAKVEEAQAALDAATAGVRSAESATAAALARLDRLTIKSPIDGRVLQVKIHEGEYAPASALATPLMTLGDDRTLVVRTDVDENDVWRFRPDAAAIAFVRGNRDQRVRLQLERIEPLVIPKRSLTGESTERVDTRVLQVLYRFPKSALPGVFVGQQMDVFIEAAPLGTLPPTDPAPPSPQPPHTPPTSLPTPTPLSSPHPPAK